MAVRLYEDDNYSTYNTEFIDLLFRCIDDDKLIKYVERELRLVDNSFKRYFDFFKYLKNSFNIGGNVIEVGYGDIPILSLLIDYEQKNLGKGTVAAFERKKGRVELPEKYSSLCLKDEFKTSEPLLRTCDLLVGVYPCEATFRMFDASKFYDLEYCIAICSCYKNDYDRVYKNAIIRNNSNFNISLDKAYSEELPILTRKK